MSGYTYPDKIKAMADLKSFSRMFAYEDKPLFLAATGGWEIRMEPKGIIEVIALNGSLYELKSR